MEVLLDTDVAIETPEHIVFRYAIAGPAKRAIAYLLDLFLCAVVITVAGIVVLLIAGGAAAVAGSGESIGKAGIGFLLFLWFCAEWVYRVVCEGYFGTSPGKRVFGLRVVTTEGRPIGFGRAALRNLLRAADILPTAYLLGVMSMTMTRRFQRLGDLVAGTMVVIPAKRSLVAPLVLHPPVHPGEAYVFEQEIPLLPEDIRAIELLLRRRGRLGYAREFELAAMLAEPIGKKYGVWHRDPVRLLALLYDRAVHSGRVETEPESLRPPSLGPQSVRPGPHPSSSGNPSSSNPTRYMVT